MIRFACVCVWLGLVVLLGPRGVAAQESHPLHVTVRLYDMAGISGQQLRTAERRADDVFRDAAVTVRWRRCRRAGGPPMQHDDTCDEVVQRIEVLVRLVTAPATVGQHVLGYSLVDRPTRTGTLSTVYADHVERLAARLRVDRGMLLGLTLAHEIGHLLLGTDLHGTSGLMRARWPDEALRRDIARDWRFSSAETSRMASALDALTTAPPPTQLAVLPLGPTRPIDTSR